MVTVNFSSSPAVDQLYTLGDKSLVWNGTEYSAYSGAATGSRYYAGLNSVIQTAGGATVLPGNAAGATATGGQYA